MRAFCSWCWLHVGRRSGRFQRYRAKDPPQVQGNVLRVVEAKQDARPTNRNGPSQRHSSPAQARPPTKVQNDECDDLEKMVSCSDYCYTWSTFKIHQIGEEA